MRCPPAGCKAAALLARWPQLWGQMLLSWALCLGAWPHDVVKQADLCGAYGQAQGTKYEGKHVSWKVGRKCQSDGGGGGGAGLLVVVVVMGVQLVLAFSFYISWNVCRTHYRVHGMHQSCHLCCKIYLSRNLMRHHGIKLTEAPCQINSYDAVRQIWAQT